MPYAHKTSQPTKDALRKGDLALAVNSTENLGPTSATGYYNTIKPPVGGYAIYSLGLNNNPIVMTVTTDDEVIRAANTLGGRVQTKSDALSYLAGRTSTWILQSYPNNIVTDGLVLALDAGSVSSYPTTGTIWYDLSGNSNNGAISGTPTFNNEGYLEFDGSSNYIDLGSNITLSKNNSTFSGWFYVEDFTTLSGAHTQQARSLAYGSGLHHLALIAAWDGGYGFENDVNSSPYEVNGTNNPPVPASDITSQKWFNFVLSFISGTARGYVNGKLISTVGSPNDLTIRYLGRASNNTNYPDYLYGNMANVKIYNKGLSADEVAQNYYGGDIVTDGLIFAVDAGNLVSYESGSTTTYSLTGSDSGTLYNGVGFDSGNGGVWEFDSVDDYINLPNDVGYSSNSVSVFAWYKINGNPTGDYHIICGGQELEMSLHKSSTYLRNGVYTTSGRFVSNDGNVTLNDGKFHYYGFTFDGSTKRAYIDGVEVGTQSVSGTLTTNFSYRNLGRFGGSTTYYANGDMGLFTLYNKVLSAEEISQNFNTQKSKFGL